MGENEDSDLERQVAAIMRKRLRLDETCDLRTLRRANHSAWDSLRHVALMLSLQKEMGVRFSASEIVRIGSFEELCALVARKRG